MELDEWEWFTDVISYTERIASPLNRWIGKFERNLDYLSPEWFLVLFWIHWCFWFITRRKKDCKTNNKWFNFPTNKYCNLSTNKSCNFPTNKYYIFSTNKYCNIPTNKNCNLPTDKNCNFLTNKNCNFPTNKYYFSTNIYFNIPTNIVIFRQIIVIFRQT